MKGCTVFSHGNRIVQFTVWKKSVEIAQKVVHSVLLSAKLYRKKEETNVPSLGVILPPIFGGILHQDSVVLYKYFSQSWSSIETKFRTIVSLTWCTYICRQHTGHHFLVQYCTEYNVFCISTLWYGLQQHPRGIACETLLFNLILVLEGGEIRGSLMRYLSPTIEPFGSTIVFIVSQFLLSLHRV